MKKNNIIEIRVSSEELAKLKQKASLTGMPLSSYIRFISLSAKIEINS